MAGKMVEFPTNGRTTQGYLATPAAGKGPGVLVIQEWWGLVPHIKSVCDRFAAEGFSALAPDMYHGKTASEPDEAGKLFMALNIAQAEKDLAGAAKYLASHSSTSKLGVVGFCMGGQLALFAGCTQPSIGAVVDFYGVHPERDTRLHAAVRPGARALRREGRVRHPGHRARGRSRDQEGRQVGRDPHISGCRSRVLQRRKSGGLQQGGGRGRLAAHPRPFPQRT